MEIKVPESKLQRMVIVGGGFGGIVLAQKLLKLNLQVVLIDKNNFHTFQPLLYQVATAGIEADSIVFPLRKIFKKSLNFHFRMADVKKVLPEQNTLQTSIGDIKYDKLIIATGSDTNFFGNEKIKGCSMAMKSVIESLDLRHSILQNFEKALNTVDAAEKQSLLTYVIVGGGPTGVELAGALGELKKHVLPHDYPELDLSLMKIYIIESAPRVLASFAEETSAKALEFVKELGVTVHLQTQVTDYDCSIAKTNKNMEIPASTLIWTAGVKGVSFEGLGAETVNRGGRIEVDQFNKVKGYQNIYAIGDVASMVTEDTPRGHPMVAQVAIQQGKLLGRNIKNEIEKKPLKPFKYNDKGSMATIGRNKAVVEVGHFKTQGIFAWFMWMFVHLIALVGFRNRVVVFINWLWSYFNYDRGMRLIIRPFARKKNEWNT